MAVAERTQSEAQRREQILSAARDVFADKGYESATISDIVKKAGVAQGTFYLYFGSKKGVVIELARKPMADMAVRLQGIINGSESFEQILRLFVREGFKVGYESPDLCRLMHMDSDNSDAVAEFEQKSEVMAMARKMFQGAINAGEMYPMDPAVGANMFKVIVSGALQLAFASETPPEEREMIAKTTEELVVRSFVTRPA